jgi:hypothetical protein
MDRRTCQRGRDSTRYYLADSAIGEGKRRVILCPDRTSGGRKRTDSSNAGVRRAAAEKDGGVGGQLAGTNRRPSIRQPSARTIAIA